MHKSSAIIKRDTLSNWEKAKNYIPNDGVIIIVDMPDNQYQLKIGDGKSYVNNLPDLLKCKSEHFVDGEILCL